MERVRILIALIALFFSVAFVSAQQTTAVGAVPNLINYSGVLKDGSGKVLTSITGVTFLIYSEQQGGAPVWMETQNVQPDARGNYTAQLGSTKPDGMPVDLFTTGEARWLALTVNGGEEQPRVLLVAVPYAMKAADAQTLGGLPASAFVLANKQATGGNSAHASANNTAPPANPAVTGKGVVDFIPMWDSASDIVDSVMFQKSSQIGIGTTSPAATLDVNGKGDVRDTLTLFPKGTDSTLAIKGTTFKVDQTGKMTFVSGQTFPGVGTVTSVALSAPTTDFKVTGSPITKSGTLALAWHIAPSSLNTASAIVKRDSTGSFSAQNVTVNGALGIGTSAPAAALDLGTNNNMVIRVDPGNDTTPANGGYQLTGRGAGGVPNTWWTYTAAVGGGFGVPANSYSIWQYPPNAVPGCCLNRLTILPATASTDTGGTVTIDQNANFSQPRAASGTVKAMIYVNAFAAPYSILRCFNSALSGAAATTPPCGINFTEDGFGNGYWDFDFGFEIDDRFFSLTSKQGAGFYPPVYHVCLGADPISPNTLQVQSTDCNGNATGDFFYLIVY
jgi:hypothetical protein